MASNKQKRRPKGDYRVGYCRPPAEHRFRPGQSGNPTGERNASRVKSPADELKELAATKVTIRDGDKTRKVSLLTANLLAHATKGAKGDVRSATVFLDKGQKLGLFDPEAFGENRIGGPDKLRPGDVLLEGLDPSLLSREEQIELSQLTAIVNRDGTILALNANQFERVRELVSKGRANDATRH
jgi:hypothetical protein